MKCQRGHSSCGVLFVDLDHFKRINDTWGHRAGDAILEEVGNRLRLTLRREDFVGRYGGEEFALMLADLDIATARQAAERVRTIISTQHYLWQAGDAIPTVSISVTASIRVAIY